jgi:hypothetical protein
MKNKKIKGKGFNAKARKGHSKGAQVVEGYQQIPEMLMPGEKGPSGPVQEEPEDAKAIKMNAKKRKRLEAFLTKQLKKDDRVKHYESLKNNSFKSELLQSSKKLGTGVNRLFNFRN